MKFEGYETGGLEGCITQCQRKHDGTYACDDVAYDK
jgi:hypothetical protein